MGSTTSKDEQKTIESSGHVNNNVIVRDTVDVYSQEIVILLGIICLMKVLEFICWMHMNQKKNLKKKYSHSVQQL